MKQEALSYFPHSDLRLFGLMLFFLVFVGVVLWVYRRGSAELYARMSELPLESGKNGKEGHPNV